MSEGIRDLAIWTHVLSPACAEVRVRVAPGELRGRLTGPRCRFASTVEVAYPLRPVPGEEGIFRAIIPEPSLWEPECPFLYDLLVEWWLCDQRMERRALTYGLRSLARMGENVLVNGRPVGLRGDAAPLQNEEDARALRMRGVNLIRAALHEDMAWDLADAFGFFVLGRLNQVDSKEVAWAMQHRAHRACLLGWRDDPPA
jgi:hypothetical protein